MSEFAMFRSSVSAHRRRILFLCATIPACEASPQSVPHRLARDTEGIRVTERPVLTIGGGGREETQFTRIVSAFALPSGAIVVANSHTPPDIRVFSPSGDLVARMGRSGEGPGEFRTLAWVKAFRADTIVAYDWSLARLSFFTAAGQLVRTQQLPGTRFSGTGYSLIDLLPDGTGLARPMYLFPPVARTGGRARVPIVRIDLETGDLTRICLVDDAQYVLREGTNRTAMPPFGLRAPVQSYEGRLFVGSGGRFHVREYALDGDTVREFSRELQRRPVTRADIAAEKARVIADAPAGYREEYTAEINEVFDQVTIPDSFPAMGSYIRLDVPASDILVDGAGNVWVQEYVGPRDTIARWSVFDPNAHYMNSVIVPRGVWIVQVTAQHLVAIHRDELGIETVHLYSLPESSLHTASGDS